MAICPGIYHLTDARDGLLARVRLPGGRISPDALVALAELSAQHGNGELDLTNRANVQVRGLSSGSAPELASGLVAAGIATDLLNRDRLRNILASPLAGIAPSELIDVSPFVDALDQALLTTPGLDPLSPKFAFLFDGGDPTGTGALSYDVGFLADSGPAGPMFRLGLASSATDFVLPPEQAVEIALAAARLAASENARMVELAASLGIVALVDRIGGGKLPLFKKAEHNNRQTRGAPLGWLPECRAVAVGFAGQPATAKTLLAIGRFAVESGATSIRVTPWRSLVIAGLDERDAKAALALANDLGLATRPSAIETIACIGARGCLRTSFQTEAAADAIRELMADWSGGKKSIHVSGCERGCARPGSAEVLVIGRDGGACVELHRRTSAGEANMKSLVKSLGPAPAGIAEGVREALDAGL